MSMSGFRCFFKLSTESLIRKTGDIMKNLTRRGKVVLFTLVIFALMGLHENIERGSINGFEYTATGGAALEVVDGAFVVEGLDAENAGISLDVGNMTSGDILFDPIPIPVGESFSARALDKNGSLIVDFELVQTGRRSTDVWLNLGEDIYAGENKIVDIYAQSDVGDEYRIHVPAEQRLFVGTVTSPSAAWAKTYHWLCAEGRCNLIIDPDETVIAFAAAPGVDVPFRYLGVVVELQNGSASPGRIELGSR